MKVIRQIHESVVDGCSTVVLRLSQIRPDERAAARGACLACEAAVSRAKDRADSPFCRALEREEAQVLT
jgi:hypothetical protein